MTRVTGTMKIVCPSHMTLAEGGAGALSAITSEENLLRKEWAKKAGVHLYAECCTTGHLWLGGKPHQELMQEGRAVNGYARGLGI